VLYVGKSNRKHWPSLLTCSGWFTHISGTNQLQVERRTGIVRQSETDVLPLCYATNLLNIVKLNASYYSGRFHSGKWKL